MSISIAEIRLSEHSEPGFDPDAQTAEELEARGYVQQEWVLRGVVAGQTYETIVISRRPADPASFSGVVIAEPMHLYGFSALWGYTTSGEYIMNSGHAWLAMAASKIALESVVVTASPQRYKTLHIPGEGLFSSVLPPFQDREALKQFWDDVDNHQPYSLAILAQIAGAVRNNSAVIFGTELKAMILGGFSENGYRAAQFAQSPYGALDESRPPLFDGYFPVGYPSLPFSTGHAPIIQVLTEGDVSDPSFAYRPRYTGRAYRRPDSNEVGDKYRLYELAGLGHWDTRNPPFNDVEVLKPFLPSDVYRTDLRLSSLPWGPFITAALHNLVAWVADGHVPPTAARLELDENGMVAKDEYGNTRGGVRPAELDVPLATYRANAAKPSGEVVPLTPSTEDAFDPHLLDSLYASPEQYITRYRTKLEVLVENGWLLPHDAEQLANEVRFPAHESVAQ